jgi:ankyrin repeat protein
MPVGFSIGDFVTLSRLTISLYNAFKSAPKEFKEINRQLESLNIVIADLKEQGIQEQSPLNQYGGGRQHELNELRENLTETMEELKDLHNRYRKMGRISWSRFQLGQENLAVLRSKLGLQTSALNAFMGSLTLGALGRMEPMLQRIYHLLVERANENMAMAQTILSAKDGPREGSADWAMLEMELKTEGIPFDYIQDNKPQIQSVLCSVVEASHLEGCDSGSENGSTTEQLIADEGSIYADDSVSQVNQPSRKGIGDTFGGILPPSLDTGFSADQSFDIPVRAASGSDSNSAWLKSLTPEEEATRKLLKNLGFDLRTFSNPEISSGELRAANTLDQEVVCWAAANGNKLALEMLIKAGCDRCSTAKPLLSSSSLVKQAILWAAEARHWSCVTVLIDEKTANTYGLTHFAAAANKVEVLERLLSMGARLDTGYDHVEYNHLSYPWLLDDDVLKDSKWTPLHFATCFSALKAIKFLLKCGVPVDATSEKMTTPLHIVVRALFKTDITLARLLIKHKAELNAVDKKARTPLHYAAYRGYSEAVKLLLDEGANMVLKDWRGETALELAKRKSRREVIRLLEKRSRVKFM